MAENTGRVVFLDRDGTINEEVHYLHKPEDLHFLPGAAEAVRMLKEAGFTLIVITNQAGVARGYYTCRAVETLHAYMNEQLRKEGGVIDAFYYCPHHPDCGIGEYKKVCHCRKPDTGMFEAAEKEFAVDKAHSYMIGDKELDIQAGHNYGVESVLVGTGYGAEHKKAAEEQGREKFYDYYAADLKAAARYIIAKESGKNIQKGNPAEGPEIQHERSILPGTSD